MSLIWDPTAEDGILRRHAHDPRRAYEALHEAGYKRGYMAVEERMIERGWLTRKPQHTWLPEHDEALKRAISHKGRDYYHLLLALDRVLPGAFERILASQVRARLGVLKSGGYQSRPRKPKSPLPFTDTPPPQPTTTELGDHQRLIHRCVTAVFAGTS